MTEAEKNWTLAFLGKAKKSAYADGSIVPTHVGHATMYQYKNPRYDGLIYTDTYVGSEMFAGNEVVTRDGHPIFSMSYAGIEFVPFDMCPDALEVLREALQKGPIEYPWNLRGCNGIIVKDTQYCVKYNSMPNYTTGTEFIFATEAFQDYCDKHNFDYVMDDTVDIIEEILSIEKEIPNWLLFRCDFTGGFLKGVY